MAYLVTHQYCRPGVMSYIVALDGPRALQRFQSRYCPVQRPNIPNLCTLHGCEAWCPVKSTSAAGPCMCVGPLPSRLRTWCDCRLLVFSACVPRFLCSFHPMPPLTILLHNYELCTLSCKMWREACRREAAVLGTGCCGRRRSICQNPSACWSGSVPLGRLQFHDHTCVIDRGLCHRTPARGKPCCIPP